MTKIALIVAATLLAFAPSVFADDSAARQRVELPDMMREHMLGNMRDHLQALTEIQQFLGAGAFDEAADTAEKRLGMSSLASHNAAHMAQFMPKDMQDIGNRMHKSASRFAIVAQESAVDGDAQRAIAALSDITEQCVACHAGYRVH
jgi:hypothetical protein